MKRKGIAGVSLALALALPLTAFAACAPQDPATGGDGGTTEELPLTPDYGIADQQYLYGLCYLLEERDYTGSPFTEDDIETEVQLMQNLGVRNVRHWIHCTTYMLDKDTMNEEACETMHAVLAACEDAGIVNIGMNHHNFNNGMSTVGKLRRNMVPGSDYLLWLEDYYTTWYHLVSEFPEVQYWEIDNELNNPDFMFDAVTQGRFTSEEMAAIATDMLWYASRGIHDANPDAVAVMGGLTERFGLGNSDTENGDPSMQWFLQAIYDNIASGVPAVVQRTGSKAGEGLHLLTQNVGQNFIAGDVLEVLQKIQAAFRAEIGIPNIQNEKKERLITGEIARGDMFTRSKAQMWLDEMREGMRQAEKLFPQIRGKIGVEFSMEVMDGAGSDALNSGVV